MKQVVVLFGLVGMLAVSTLPAGAELCPGSGQFTGYYRVDRWGLHKFAGMPVDPKAQEAFKDYRDVLVTANVTQIDQPINPGPCFIHKVGKITPVKDVPVEIKLAWADEDRNSPAIYRRIDRGGEFKFKVSVTNKTGIAIGPDKVRSDGFFLGGSLGANLPPRDVEWDMAKMRGPGTPSREWKMSGFDLPSGNKTSWTVTISNARPGEYEFFVSYLEYDDGEPGYKRVESNLLRLDVVNDRPRPAAGLELQLVPDPNPPRPPRSIPAKLLLRNTGAKPLNFFLPYRKDKLAVEQLVRCFDPSGVMVIGPRPPQSSGQLFGRQDYEYKPQRLEPRKATTLDLTLPYGTVLAAAQVRGGVYPPKETRKPDEDYFLDGGPSVSAYVRVGR